MAISTISLDRKNKANSELEKAGKEAKALRLTTADGQCFIVFPEEGFERMCEVLQSPEFITALKEGHEQYQRGEVKLVRGGKHM